MMAIAAIQRLPAERHAVGRQHAQAEMKLIEPKLRRAIGYDEHWPTSGLVGP